MRSRTCGKDGGAGVPSGTLNAPLATFRDSRIGQRGGKGRRAMGPSLWLGCERPSSHVRFHQQRVGAGSQYPGVSAGGFFLGAVGAGCDRLCRSIRRAIAWASIVWSRSAS